MDEYFDAQGNPYTFSEVEEEFLDALNSTSYTFHGRSYPLGDFLKKVDPEGYQKDFEVYVERYYHY